MCDQKINKKDKFFGLYTFAELEMSIGCMLYLLYMETVVLIDSSMKLESLCMHSVYTSQT